MASKDIADAFTMGISQSRMNQSIVEIKTIYDWSKLEFQFHKEYCKLLVGRAALNGGNVAPETVCLHNMSYASGLRGDAVHVLQLSIGPIREYDKNWLLQDNRLILCQNKKGFAVWDGQWFTAETRYKYGENFSIILRERVTEERVDTDTVAARLLELPDPRVSIGYWRNVGKRKK